MTIKHGSTNCREHHTISVAMTVDKIIKAKSECCCPNQYASAEAACVYLIEEETEQATAAAQLMGMVSLPVSDDALAQLAHKLPGGKIFGSGKTFVPFVGEKLFEQLASRLLDRSVLQTLRAAASAAEAEGDGGEDKAHNLPKDWATLKSATSCWRPKARRKAGGKPW